MTTDTIPDTGPALVDFYADWCGPCHAVAPVLEKLALDKGIPVVKVDIDVDRETTEMYGVVSIPTIVYFVDGEEQARSTGAFPRTLLESRLGLTPSG